MSRYRVTELEGYLTCAPTRGGSPGLTCSVIDAAWCCSVVAAFRTEDYRGGGREAVRADVRARAAAVCDRLNSLNDDALGGAV